MKSLVTCALAVILSGTAAAQLASPGQQPFGQKPIEVELLELDQEVDKTILREALMLQARQDMKTALDAHAETKRSEREAEALREFIAKKKEAIIARAAEMRKTRAAGMQAAARVAPAAQPVNKQDIVEKAEKAQIEVQLLQAQVNLLQMPLSKAIDALANAEFAASDDETLRPKAEAARKEYEKVKARSVELSKRLQLEQQELQSMQMMGGMGMAGGMGGGFR